MLVGVHTSLAFLTGRTEILLDTTAKVFDGLNEAEFLAKSIKDVSDHYKVEWLDKKSIDWMNLVQCLMIVYGGRIYAIKSNPKIKVAPAPQPVATRAGPPPQQHRAGVMNGNENPMTTAGVPEQTLRTGEVAGLGEVVFPPDHPLMGGRKPN